MCQFLYCCDCCWHNQCGAMTGLAWNYFCMGCWICMPPQLESTRGSQCCKCGQNQGYGSSCFCVASMCCIPDYLRNYSIRATIKEKRGIIYDIEIVQRNLPQFGGNQAPPTYQQQNAIVYQQNSGPYQPNPNYQ